MTCPNCERMERAARVMREAGNEMLFLLRRGWSPDTPESLWRVTNMWETALAALQSGPPAGEPDTHTHGRYLVSNPEGVTCCAVCHQPMKWPEPSPSGEAGEEEDEEDNSCPDCQGTGIGYPPPDGKCTDCRGRGTKLRPRTEE